MNHENIAASVLALSLDLGQTTYAVIRALLEHDLLSPIDSLKVREALSSTFNEE